MLPRPDGPFEVGVITLGLQVPRKVIGKGRLKANGLPALELQECVFNLYYPAGHREPGRWRGWWKRRSKLGVRWIQRPLSKAVQGWAKFLHQSTFLLWPVVHLLNALLSIPALPNAPLLQPNPKFRRSDPDEDMAKKWPFVIFSHGLGGSRTGYSNYCTQLASDGRVVLAMEHHDGSGVHSTVRPNLADEPGAHQKGYVLYIEPGDVEHPKGLDEEIAPAMPFRVDQLSLRREEIYNAVDAFRQFVESPNSNHGLFGIDDDESILASRCPNWNSWKGAVHFEDIFITGHSFGASTLLSILANPPPTSASGESFDPLPITKAIAMDPWLEPFPTPGPCLLRDSSQSASGEVPNLLVISSEGFTLWGEHFDRLEGLVKSWGQSGSDIGPSKHGTHLTLPTALHVNFSDFPLFLPRVPRHRQGNARKLLSTMHQVSSSFLEDELGYGGEESWGLLGELQNEGRLRSMEIELIPSKTAVDEKGTLSWKGRKLKGITGDVILHGL